MLKRPSLYAIFSCAGLLAIGGLFALRSQSTGNRAAALIHDKVDENKLVTLAGNTRGEAANADNDLGAVGDGLILDHMMLQLKRSPEQEQAAVRFVDELHNSKSPNFHKWITAAEFGKNYGLAEADIQTITGWLVSHGFTVNSVYQNGLVIDFSGSAGQVGRAFHTSIHNLNVNGVRHIGNVSDPQIPAALAPAVAGVVSLHDFRPSKMSRPKYTFTYQGQQYQAVVPADLATIYDISALFSKGTTGSGQTVAVIEDSDLYSTLDWTKFRSEFGLTQYSSGSLSTVHPSGCADPGVNGDDSEAALDAEWATAAAPGAAIMVAACADTNVTFGGFIAMQNLLNGGNPPSIMSISYGNCEAENGVSSNASINSLYQQAVMQGVSVFVSAGDEGAASCDAGALTATHGIGVSAYASTPYNVSVGGTDFSDVLNNSTSTYWNRTNLSTYGSAIGYIPEIPWNDSCANSLYASYMGFSTGYGANGFCNSSAAMAGQANGAFGVAGGSGGPSNCATGVPSTFGVSNGSCQGYAKPSWQTGLAGIPSDGVRDMPDVSMFASDGEMWGHYAVVCFSDEENGGAPCSQAPLYWAGFGGTSLAAPVMAGIQALVNQKMGGAQGNPNYVYYAMAASTPNAFHSVTQGDIDQNCGGPVNCYGVLGTVVYGRGGRVFGTTWAGALSTSSSSFASAYAATPGWNFATGIGSVDAYNLVMNWSSAQ